MSKINTKQDVKMNRRFIILCKEAQSIVDGERIWQEEAEEPLEKIIDRFLKTGYLSYIQLPFDTRQKQKKIKIKIYPKISKIYLWGALGRFRKRIKKLGGNMREYFYD